MTDFVNGMNSARNKALELAKKLGVDYDPPLPPSEDEICQKTELYFSLLENKEEIRKILDSITDEERLAYKKLQDSEK